MSRVKYECWVSWNQELITWGMLILNGLGRESSSPHWEGNITCWCPGLCTGILELRPTVRATYFVAPEFRMTNLNLGRQSPKSSPTASVILLWEFLLLNVRSRVILACNGYNASKGGLLDWLNPEAVIAHSKKRGGLESADSTCEFNHFTSFDHLFIFKVYRQRKLAMFRKFIERSCMKRVIFDCFSLQLGRVFLGIGVGVPFSCRFGWPFFLGVRVIAGTGSSSILGFLVAFLPAQKCPSPPGLLLSTKLLSYSTNKTSHKVQQRFRQPKTAGISGQLFSRIHSWLCGYTL